MTGRALSSDWLKIRGKGIWFLVFLAPLGLTAMQALNFGLRLDYLKEQYADNLWGGLLGNVVVFVPLSLMLGATILSSMIANVEHEQGSWKQLLAMPIPRPAVYLAKFLLACVLLVISCLLLNRRNCRSGSDPRIPCQRNTLDTCDQAGSIAFGWCTSGVVTGVVAHDG